MGTIWGEIGKWSQARTEQGSGEKMGRKVGRKWGGSGEKVGRTRFGGKQHKVFLNDKNGMQMGQKWGCAI